MPRRLPWTHQAPRWPFGTRRRRWSGQDSMTMDVSDLISVVQTEPPAALLRVTGGARRLHVPPGAAAVPERRGRRVHGPPDGPRRRDVHRRRRHRTPGPHPPHRHGGRWAARDRRGERLRTPSLRPSRPQRCVRPRTGSAADLWWGRHGGGPAEDRSVVATSASPDAQPAHRSQGVVALFPVPSRGYPKPIIGARRGARRTSAGSGVDPLSDWRQTSHSETFESAALSARIARDVLRGICDEALVPAPMVETALLLVSEVVTNAVVHGRGDRCSTSTSTRTSSGSL